jgi:hypothetical protein
MIQISTTWMLHGGAATAPLIYSLRHIFLRLMVKKQQKMSLWPAAAPAGGNPFGGAVAGANPFGAQPTNANPFGAPAPALGAGGGGLWGTSAATTATANPFAAAAPVQAQPNLQNFMQAQQLQPLTSK